MNSIYMQYEKDVTFLCIFINKSIAIVVNVLVVTYFLSVDVFRIYVSKIIWTYLYKCIK